MAVTVISISTYFLFCACTQNELGQTSNISIHHIHCKGNINIYFLFMHLHKSVRSNKQHQHSPYSLQRQYQYLLPILCIHRAKWVKQVTSASIISIARVISISAYNLFCAFAQNEFGQTSNISIHHIHCKGNINIYLQAILCIHRAS